MLYPHLSPQFSRQLKDEGFPQPELAPYQYWYSLLDEPFVVIGQMCDSGEWEVYNLKNEKIYLIKSKSDGMLYAPTIQEAFNFRYKHH